MKKILICTIAVLGLVVAGCSTSARFIIPDNTELVVRGQKAERDVQGVYIRMRPFFWSAFGGINYQLLQQNSVVQEGKLSAGFRIASIFWPPYAILYWPAGFSYNCYDLTRPVPVSCSKGSLPVQNASTGADSAPGASQ